MGTNWETSSVPQTGPPTHFSWPAKENKLFQPITELGYGSGSKAAAEKTPES